MVLAAYIDQLPLTGELPIEFRQMWWRCRGPWASDVSDLVNQHQSMHAIGMHNRINSIDNETFQRDSPPVEQKRPLTTSFLSRLLGEPRPNPAKHPAQQLGNLERVPCAPRQLAVVETFEDDPLPLVTPLYSWQTFLETPQEPLMVAVSP